MIVGTELMDREGFREGEGETGGVGTRENPTRPREPDPHHSQRTERDSERGEGETGMSLDKRRPNPTKGNQTPTTTTDREEFRERGEGDLDGLERGTGGQEVGLEEKNW